MGVLSWAMIHPSPTHNYRMNLPRHNALVAILARIDEQIVESDTLLLTTLTGPERRRVMDELVYLQIERLKAAANLHNHR